MSNFNKLVIKPELKIQILDLLNEGFKPKFISNKLGINYSTLFSFVKKERPDLKFNPVIKNENYFNIIDSHSKAYILGFICADGAIVESKTTTSLTITVKYEDKPVLDFIKSELCSNHNLLEIIRPSGFDKNKNIHHIRLSFSNKNIINDLMKFGITTRKSLTMDNLIQNIPFEYRDSFIIGYFDGDGSAVTKDKLRQKPGTNKFYPNYTIAICIRGTRNFLSGICEHLNIKESYIKEYDSIPRLTFSSKKDVVRFFNCYKNLDFYYTRKYNKFLEKINHKSYDKYK